MNIGARWLGRYQRMWLASVAMALAAGASMLARPPSALTGADASTAKTFAALASAAIVAVSVLPLMWRGPARRPIWLSLAVVALLLGIGSFAAGGYAQRACMARYGEKSTIIGTDLTPLGATYKKTNPQLSNDELLFDAAGVPDRIWTRSSIDGCRVFISSTYFLWIPFLVVCLLATVQAIPTATFVSVARAAPASQGQGSAAGPRYDVFLSYRHGGADTEVATQLLEALEGAGYSVAIDDRDFPANASFLQEMERCIRESRVTVAVISSRYLDSGNCQEEAIICKVLDMSDRKRRLIPFVIEHVSMPTWLYGIVGIDCTKQNPLVDPFDKLKSTLGPPLGTSATQPS